MAAKVYNAPSNPFRRGIMAKAASPGGGSSHEGGGGTNKGGPMGYSQLAGDLGNPALYQNFSGAGAPFAEFGQMMWKDRAFQDQQKALNESLSAFSNKIGGGMPLPNALMELMKEDGGKHFMNLQGAGLLDSLEKFQLFQTQAQNLANAGQTQTFKFPGGDMVHQVIGPDGKPHFMNSSMASRMNADTSRGRLDLQSQIAGSQQMTPGITGPGGNVATQNKFGQTGEAQGFKPTSSVNAEANREAAEQRRLNQPRYDASKGIWAYPPGADGKSRVVPIEGVEAKLTNPEAQFFSVAPNLVNALKKMDELMNVTGPISGKVRTAAGVVFGEDQAIAQWRTARDMAENAIASMGQAGGGYVAGMKERLNNLPKDWVATPPNRLQAQETIRHIQEQVGTRAAASENNNLVLPQGVADSLAKMGVFTKRFTPALTRLREDASQMTDQEVKSLAPYSPYLSAEDRQKFIATVQQRMKTSAEQAQQPVETNQ